MKIAVMADIHGNMAYLERAKEIIDDSKIEIIIVCGDVQDFEALEELDSWKQKVYLSLGNADYEIRYKLESGQIQTRNVEVSLDYGHLKIGGTEVAFCHYPNYARKLAESGRYNVVFYDHNHRPWEEKVGQAIMLNPGEIQARDGKPTFAIYDLSQMKAELKILV